jgi:hypothetical protein
MRNIVFGAIGVIWGGIILIRFLQTGLQGEGAYRAGQVVALILMLLMVVAGAYYLVTGILALQGPPKRRKRKRPKRPRDDD